MFDLATPLRGLVVGLVAAGLAWLSFNDLAWLAVIAAAAAISLGVALDWVGKALLPSSPRAAVRVLEWWVITPAMIAAVAGALVIIVTVALTVPEGTAANTKETVGAISAAITGFITTAFVSWSSDEKDSSLADHIRDAFRDHYGRAGGKTKPGVHYFKADSPGERWVYGEEFRGIEGWGRAARFARARGIAKELATGESDP